MKPITITQGHLETALRAEFEAVCSSKTNRRIRGRKVTLYSSNTLRGKDSTIGLWCGGRFYTENQHLAKVISTTARA